MASSVKTLWLSMWMVTWVSVNPVPAQEYPDAFSRPLSIYNINYGEAPTITDAFGPELSLYNLFIGPSPTIADAMGRQLTLYNLLFSQESLSFPDSHSRAFSVSNSSTAYSLITFLENPVGTAISNEYGAQGLLFVVQAGDLQITNDFSTISGVDSPVFADVNANPATPGLLQLLFREGGTGEQATTNFFSCDFIDISGPGTVITTFDLFDHVLQSYRVPQQPGAAVSVQMSLPGISRVQIELGAGSARGAIDNLRFNTPVAQPFEVNIDSPEPGFQIDVGAPLTLTASVANGIAPITYDWVSDLEVNPLGTVVDGDLTLSTLVPGNHVITVTATDSAMPPKQTSTQVSLLVIESPDLQVTNISAVSTVFPGETLSVSYDVVNSGNGEACVEDGDGNGSTCGSWRDRIYLSSNPNSSGDDLLVATLVINGPSEGVSGPIPVGESYSRTVEFEVSPALSGDYEIVVRVDAVGNELLEINGENNNSATRPLTVVAPDLEVTAVTASSDAVGGQSISVNWTVTNTGLGSQSGTWIDRVYFGASPTEFAGAIPLGEFGIVIPEGAPLESGESYSRSVVVPVPNIAGEFWVWIATDATGVINEIAGESNNLGVSPTSTSVELAPLPDLVAQVTEVLTTTFESGGALSLRFQVTNMSVDTVTQVASWNDVVLLSDESAAAGMGPVVCATSTAFVNPTPLEPGQSYQQVVAVSLPNDVSGDYFIYVVTDQSSCHGGGVVQESNELNNVAQYPTPITIELADQPDLVATLLSPTTTSGTITGNGQPLAVQWQDSNVGAGPTDANAGNASRWSDRISLRPTATPGAGLIPLATLSPAYFGTVLAGGGAATTGPLSVNPTLPYDFQPGDYEIIIEVDINNEISELGFEDNQFATGVTVQVTQQPTVDLSVTTVAAPSTIVPAQSFSVSWDVANLLLSPVAGASLSWTDQIYLSTDPTLDVGDLLLRSYGHSINSSDLIAGSVPGYPKTRSFPFPTSPPEGTYYVIVVTDATDTVREVVAGLDAEQNNVGVSTSTIEVVFSPADLRIGVDPQAPLASAALAGASVALNWKVSNNGTGVTPASVWIDQVLLVSPGGGAHLLASAPRNAALAPGESYLQSRLVQIPAVANGNDYLLELRTDVTNSVFEQEGENNNSFVSTFSVLPGAADLTIDPRSVVVAPRDVVDPGASITVQWTVVNQGPEDTIANSFADGIYLVRSGIENPTPLLLGTRSHSGVLPAAGSSTVAKSFTVPTSLLPGLYELRLVTDFNNSVFESEDSNNTFVKSMLIDVATLAASNLVTSAVAAPATGVGGQPLSVSWTVENVGDGATAVSSWRDAVYLSLDTFLDKSNDIYLGSRTHNGFLDGFSGATTSYSVSGYETPIPIGITGDFFLLVISDSLDQVTESDDLDNISFDPQPITIASPPPADLIVSSVSFPTPVDTATLTPGRDVTWVWNISNVDDGSGDAQDISGSWNDSLFLSAVATGDPDDLLIGRFGVSATNLMVGGASVQFTRTSALPGVLPGDYYVVVRTDVLNQIPEVDNGNNLGATVGTVSIDVPPLVIDGPAYVEPGAVLLDGNGVHRNVERFFKIDVTEVGQSFRVSAEDTRVGSEAWINVFIAFERIPSVGNFDAAATLPARSIQDAVISTSDVGYYYVLVQAVSATGSPPAVDLEVTATNVPYGLDAVVPNRVGSHGVTLEIFGGRLLETESLRLEHASLGISVDPVEFLTLSGTDILAGFDLTMAPLGAYHLLASSALEDVELLAAVVIEDPTPLSVAASISSSPNIRRGTAGGARISIDNLANTNLPYVTGLLVLPNDVEVGAQFLDLDLEFVELPDARVASFLIRQLGPSQQVQFDLELDVSGGYGGESLPLVCAVRAYSTGNFINQWLPAQTESLRQAVLSSATAPQFAVDLAQDPSHWFTYIATELGGLSFQPETLQPGVVALDTIVEVHAPNQHLEDACALLSEGVEGVLELALARELCAEQSCENTLEGECGSTLAINCIGALTEALIETTEGQGGASVSLCIPTPASDDPNEKSGPSGGGLGYVSPTQTLSYRIDFENQSAAAVPAGRVVIVDPLQPTFDISHFQLGNISFGDQIIAVPPNLAFYTTSVDVAESLGVAVKIVAFLDISEISAPQVVWIFESLDPLTAFPPTNAFLGFLPPNDFSGRGQGFVEFSARASATTGVTGGGHLNAAAITFDDNEEFSTNVYSNILDVDAPTSAIAPAVVQLQSSPVVQLGWTGADQPLGAGLDSYTVYVSCNGGSAAPLIARTRTQETTFVGVPGNAYSFYTRARDLAGNVESPPSDPFGDVLVSILGVRMTTATDTGVAGDQITANNTPTFVGAAEPTGSVSIQITGPSSLSATVPTNMFGCFNYTPIPLSDGVYQITVTAAGLSASTTFEIDTVAPQVAEFRSVRRHGSDSQALPIVATAASLEYSEPRLGVERLQVKFDRPLNPAASSFSSVLLSARLANGTDLLPEDIDFSVVVDAEQGVVTVEIPNGLVNLSRYRLRVVGGTDLAGNVAADSEVTLSVLAGDVDGDREVDRRDLLTVRRPSPSTFGGIASAANPRHDLNGDGVVNLDDETIIRSAQGDSVLGLAEPPLP